jgi:hypothetical protein
MATRTPRTIEEEANILAETLTAEARAGIDSAKMKVYQKRQAKKHTKRRRRSHLANTTRADAPATWATKAAANEAAKRENEIGYNIR